MVDINQIIDSKKYFSVKKVLFLTVVILMMVMVSGNVLAAHTSDVTIVPSVLGGAVDDLSFTVTACNDAGSDDNIHEFRIYYEWEDFDQFTDVKCADKTGWYKYIVNGIWGYFCLYTAETSGDEIVNGSCTNFEFTADTPAAECCRELRFETRDVISFWQFVDTNVCVDATPPETTKWYVGPQKFLDGKEWITPDTEVWLDATECPDGCDDETGPHNSTVVATYYKDIYLEESDDWDYCETDCHTWDPEKPQDPLNPGGSWDLWDGTPFYKSPESCHIIEFYSVDGAGNPEVIKWQCVYVDDTPPNSDKQHGTPLIQDSGFDWVTQATTITLDCIDSEPHPVEQETMCYKVSLDDVGLEYLTDAYCTEFGGAMNNEDYCCVYVGDSPLIIHFLEDSYHNLEYYCIDHLGNDERYVIDGGVVPHIQWYKVDDTPPYLIDKRIEGPRYEVNGNCPPDDETDICHLDGDSVIYIEVMDGGDICAVDEVWCQWGYTLDDGDFSGWYQYNSQAGISFPEETKHDLIIECYDALGNKMVDEETFYVDKTKPATTKTYGEPQYSAEYSFADTVVVSDGSVGNLEVTVEEDGEWMVWTFDFPVELFTGDGNLNVGLIIAKDGVGNGPAFQIHNNDGSDANYAWGEWLMSPWGPTIGDGWFGWHSGDTNTPVTSLSWVEATGNRNVPHNDGVMEIRIKKSELGSAFHWAASPTVGSGFYAPAYDVTMQIPTGFGWSTPLVDMGVPNYVYAVGYPKWITSATEISLSATDSVGPHDSGVKETKYRVTLLGSNEACESDARCQEINTDGGDWTTYSTPFTIGEPSCHLIEYYSVDNVDKTEDVKRQCVYVEDTPPTVWKKVGAPNATSDLPDTYFISGETPITMFCEDMGDHPVDHVSLWYRYRVSDDCETWGDWLPVNPEDCEGEIVDGWCDPNGHVVKKTIYFPEDSCHELEYFCIDGLGNPTEVFKEIDIVDSQPPVIEKTIVGPYIDCPPVEWGTEECIKWDCLPQEDEKDFFVTGRHDPTNWDMAIKTPPEVVEAQGEYVWTNDGTPVPFLVSYDPDTGEVTFDIDGSTLYYTYDAGKAFTHLVLMSKGADGGCDMALTNVEVNGNSVGDIISTGNYQGLKVFLPDADQATGFTVTGDAAMIWDDGCKKQEIPAFHVFAMNTHDPVEDCFLIDGITEIHVDAYDPDPHPSNAVWCEWTYWWDEAEYGPYFEDTFPFTISAWDESEHLLEIYCEDALGNYVEDIELFIVDKTPPETTKWYEGPQYPEDILPGCTPYPHWITSSTEVWLSAEDPEPHPSGVAATWYRDVYLDNPEDWHFCAEDCGEWELDGRYSAYGLPTAPEPYNPKSIDDRWEEWTGTPFHKSPESCHIIEYYSYDNVGKVEKPKWQCVFVDNTPPTPEKIVGEPKDVWTPGENGDDPSYFYPEETAHCWDGTGEQIDCWEVTMMTEISLDCTDPDPHPVDHEMVCFNVGLDGEDATEEYCDWYSGSMEDDGFCCVDHTIEEFTFYEETEHNLKYYCVDALGNTNLEIDEEKFKVTGTKFEIPLFKKWNLISVPFTLFNDDPEVVFEDVAEHTDSVWAYDPDNHMCDTEWCVWRPGDGFLDNLRIWPGWGYWVLMDMEMDEEPEWLLLGGELFSTGPVAPPTRDLQAGWNLIGYYGTSWELYDWMDFSFECGDSFDFADRFVYGDKVYCSLNSLVDTQQGYPRWAALWNYINCGDHHTAWLGLNTCADHDSPLQMALSRMYAGRGYWVELDVEDRYIPATSCIWNDDFECRMTGGGIMP